MITIEKLMFLRQVELLSELPVSELGNLATRATEIEVPDQSPIIRQGQAGTSLFIVVEGHVQVSDSGSPIAELGPGQYFGEIAILADVPATASVSALGDACLLSIARADFHEILANNFDCVLAVIRRIVGRISERPMQAIPPGGDISRANTRQTVRDA